VLYQFLLDDVARKQIKPEVLRNQGIEAEYVEGRQANSNNLIKNKSQIIRTLSSKSPETRHPSLDQHDKELRSSLKPRFSPVSFGATVERNIEPLSATSTESKRHSF